MHTVMHPSHSRGTAPANDRCATPLAPSVDHRLQQPAFGDNTSATESEAVAGCDLSTKRGDLRGRLVHTFNSGANTSVEIAPQTMTDWVLVVLDGCGGLELACQIQPAGIVPIARDSQHRLHRSRLFEHGFGDPGTFTLCATAGAAAPPTMHVRASHPRTAAVVH